VAAQTPGRLRAPSRISDNGQVFTRIVLIRHGLTDSRSRLCGSFDVPLTPEGEARVHALLQYCARYAAPDALFTSTLTRARDVAMALGRAWTLEPQLAEWAREIHCGDVEGMPLAQLQRDFPDLWARNQAQVDDAFAWPGGETYTQFRARVLAGLEAVATSYAGGRVTVVTHAGVISQVLGVIRARPPAAWTADRPDPLTATEVTWDDGAPGTVLTFNNPDWY
jgi:probable phosphoglycerate mutase